MSFSIDDSEALATSIAVQFALNCTRFYVVDKYTEGPILPVKDGDVFKRFKYKNSTGEESKKALTDAIEITLSGVDQFKYKKITWKHQKGLITEQHLDEARKSKSRMESIATILQVLLGNNQPNENLDKIDALDCIFIIYTQQYPVNKNTINVMDLCQAYLEEKDIRQFDLNFLTQPKTVSLSDTVMKLDGIEEREKLISSEKDSHSGCCGRRSKATGYIYGCGLSLIYACNNVWSCFGTCLNCMCCGCRQYCFC